MDVQEWNSLNFVVDMRSMWISSNKIVVQDSLLPAHTVSVCMYVTYDYVCMYVCKYIITQVDLSLGSKHSATEMEKV